MSSLDSVSIPRSFIEALSLVGWQQAMINEMTTLHSNGTLDLVSLPLGKSLLVVDRYMQLRLILIDPFD